MKRVLSTGLCLQVVNIFKRTRLHFKLKSKAMAQKDFTGDTFGSLLLSLKYQNITE